MSRLDRPFGPISGFAEPMKRLTINIPLVMHTTVAAAVLLAFWFWP
jgi:hypothetical protein